MANAVTHKEVHEADIRPEVTRHDDDGDDDDDDNEWMSRAWPFGQDYSDTACISKALLELRLALIVDIFFPERVRMSIDVPFYGGSGRCIREHCFDKWRKQRLPSEFSLKPG